MLGVGGRSTSARSELVPRQARPEGCFASMRGGSSPARTAKQCMARFVPERAALDLNEPIRRSEQRASVLRRVMRVSRPPEDARRWSACMG
jgi:hypothetical protein